MNNIPYENVYTMEFSEKGQIPYVEFNGSQIADRSEGGILDPSIISFPALLLHVNLSL